MKVYGKKIIELYQTLEEGATEEGYESEQQSKWKDIYQTLEEGFESQDNLVASCELLQQLDYKLHA